MLNMREQEQNNQASNTGTSSERKNVQSDSIRASDASRNDERDQRIGEEPDTARLRSEKESVEKGKTQ